MSKNFGYVLSSIGLSITMAQTERIFQLIGLACTIIMALVTLISNIIDWVKRAKADGKISEEEVEEGFNILLNGANEIQGEIDKRLK